MSVIFCVRKYIFRLALKVHLEVVRVNKHLYVGSGLHRLFTNWTKCHLYIFTRIVLRGLKKSIFFQSVNMSQGLKVRRSFEAGGRGRASRWQLPQANARKLRRNVWEFRRYWRYRRFFYVTQACTFNTLWSPEFLPGRYLYYHRHKNLIKANSKQNKNSGTR